MFVIFATLKSKIGNFACFSIVICGCIACSGNSDGSEVVTPPVSPVKVPTTPPSTPPTQPPVTPPPSQAPSNPPPEIAMPTLVEAFHRPFYEVQTSRVSYSQVLQLPFQASERKIRYGSDTLQFVEYWPPTAVAGRENLPAIVLIHGGCWLRSFRLEQSYPLATALALNGFPVWSIEYRAVGDEGGGWPGTFEDVLAALSYIYNQGTEFYSPRPLVTLGHSAGGHLALLAGSEVNTDVIGLAPIADIVAYSENSTVCQLETRNFIGGTFADFPERFIAASPKLDELRGNGYIFIGENDAIIPISQADNAGLPVLKLNEIGHFEWIHPGTEAFDILLSFLVNEAG
jgi:pimeloyl-ACP methyl ester carboxylesterase